MNRQRCELVFSEVTHKIDKVSLALHQDSPNDVPIDIIGDITVEKFISQIAMNPYSPQDAEIFGLLFNRIMLPTGEEVSIIRLETIPVSLESSGYDSRSWAVYSP